MGDFYLGQIEFFAFGVTPKGWAQCNGQILSIASNQALFALISNTYGGNGQTTFALPDLRGRVLAGPGTGMALGSTGGEETHHLSVDEMPLHTHNLLADAQTAGSSNGSTPAANTVLGNTAAVGGGMVNVYATGTPNGSMAPQTIAPSGAGAPHENRMPFVALNACIAITGIYPVRN